jgi:hypothetical protein
MSYCVVGGVGGLMSYCVVCVVLVRVLTSSWLLCGRSHVVLCCLSCVVLVRIFTYRCV